jgi:hypothetical protein
MGSTPRRDAHMTRKDYVVIARCFASVRLDLSAKEVVGRLAQSLADEFVDDNPRFDEARFLKACGVEV